MTSEKIPGDIFRTTYFFGLTFTEVATLASVPAAAVFPTFVFSFIPFWFTILLSALFGVGVIVIGIRSPEGQTPLEWAPEAALRRVRPDTYYLKHSTETPDAQLLDAIQVDIEERETYEPPEFDPQTSLSMSSSEMDVEVEQPNAEAKTKAEPSRTNGHVQREANEERNKTQGQQQQAKSVNGSGPSDSGGPTEERTVGEESHESGSAENTRQVVTTDGK